VERVVSAPACPACGEALVEGARFCEACGAPANGSVDAAASPSPAEPDLVAPEPARGPGADADETTLETPAPSGPTFGPCDKCGGEVADDGYCTSCGHRAIEDVTVDDRVTMAYATHRGRRHARNEDAAALGTTAEGWPVVVVSDGVSISPNPHLASAAAVAAAAERLTGRPFGGSDDLAAAVADAHAAACAVPIAGDPYWQHDDGTHPACTIVVAVATDTQVHVANVGDARAHLLSGDGDDWTAAQLTTDDSLAAQAVAQGIDAEVALNLPGGHAITAWLGADAHGLAAHIATVDASPGDVLIVSSDGLWNYAATDDALGELVAATFPRPGSPVEPLAGLCERLVSWAVDQGGVDNICVALAPLPAASATAPQATDPETTDPEATEPEATEPENTGFRANELDPIEEDTP
jgi:serine/threonine protein phosphatase PrpC